MNHVDVPVHIAHCAGTALSGDDLRAALMGMGDAIDGLYRPPFTFQGRINADGTLWGRNNFGTTDAGTWRIEGDHLHLNWQGGWDDTITQACRDGAVLHFFDVESGAWRMALTPAGEE